MIDPNFIGPRKPAYLTVRGSRWKTLRERLPEPDPNIDTHLPMFKKALLIAGCIKFEAIFTNIEEPKEPITSPDWLETRTYCGQWQMADRVRLTFIDDMAAAEFALRYA